VIIDHGKVIASGTLDELVQRTVGRHRLVTIKVDVPFEDAANWVSPRLPSGTVDLDAADRRLIRAKLNDVGAELPPLLDHLRQAGRLVDDLDVRGPSLQSVFIHLTGRELRE
jgi:ABC-2 type transport system ATP-binding protein